MQRRSSISAVAVLAVVLVVSAACGLGREEPSATSADASPTRAWAPGTTGPGDEPTIVPTPPPPSLPVLVPEWTQRTGGWTGSVRPVVLGSRVVTIAGRAGEGDVRSFALVDGTPGWRWGGADDASGLARRWTHDRIFVLGNELSPDGSMRASLWALDAGNGSELWHTLLPGGGVTMEFTPLVSWGVVLGTSGGGPGDTLVGLSAQDGRVLLTHYEGSPFRSGAIQGDVAVVPVSGGLRALELRTGELRWGARVGGQTVDGAAASQGRAYVATFRSGGGDVQAFAIEDGAALWKVRLYEPGPPTASGASVYVGTGAGEVLAIRARDGSVMWRTDLDVASCRAAPTVAGDVVLVPCEGGKGQLGGLIVIDRASGEPVAWSGGERRFNRAGPAVVARKRVFVELWPGGLAAFRFEGQDLPSS
jgi:outer membrane protein assembly factor BamB